jgi:hypothetical protein
MQRVRGNNKYRDKKKKRADEHETEGMSRVYGNRRRKGNR